MAAVDEWYKSYDDDNTARVADPPSMEEVPMEDRRSSMPTEVAKRYCMPSDPVQLCLTAPARKPPLMWEKSKQVPAVYDMGADWGGSVTVELKLKSADDGHSFDDSVPLKMLPYMKLSDPTDAFDIAKCRALDAENDVIVKHNRYITSLLSLFIAQNGCTTSANHVTLPSPPDNLIETRKKRLANLFADKHAAMILAVRYLAKHGMQCEEDYPIENSVAMADECAFGEEVTKRTQPGKPVRFRIPGSPPTSWSGDPADRDGLARRVKWAPGPLHSFMAPDVNIVLANDELSRHVEIL
jgi:hypothetical protein